MKTMHAENSADNLELLIPKTQPSDGPLKVCLLFDSETTRAWARESAEQLRSLSADETIQATWWRLNELTAPGVLAGAVSTAMRANVVVVATEATEGLPLPFYIWMNGWASNRRQAAGAIVLLTGDAPKKSSKAGRVAKYLKAVAQQIRLEMVHQICEVSAIDSEAEMTF